MCITPLKKINLQICNSSVILLSFPAIKFMNTRKNRGNLCSNTVNGATRYIHFSAFLKIITRKSVFEGDINCLNVIGIDRISNWPDIRPSDATADTGYPARLATGYLAVYTPESGYLATLLAGFRIPCQINDRTPDI